MATAELGATPRAVPMAGHEPGRQAGLWSDAARRIRRDRPTVIALVVLGALVVLAASADLLANAFFHYSFSRQDLLNSYTRPELSRPAFWLGTDNLGRSEIVRLLYGARISLAVGFGAAFINLTIGLAVGLAAGYFRGWVDDMVQFVISTLVSIPSLFLLLIVAVLFSPSAVTLVIILGLLSWPHVSLFVRGQTLSLGEREFVTAAKVVGANSFRLVVLHVLPNVLPLVIVLSAIDVGTLILTESALSFLGLGIQPPTPSWGNMLTNAASDLSHGPWLVYGPGTAIFLTVLCLYLIGDGLRDALDPRINRLR